MENSFVFGKDRTFSKEDKVFSLSGRAKKRISEIGKENVIDATLGSLVDEKLNFVLMDTVDEVFKSLKKREYGSYAPIAGLPKYREYMIRAFFLDYTPKGYTSCIATSGGTGAIRNAIYNYVGCGDEILVHDWMWGNYKSICNETGTKIHTFSFFNEEDNFNLLSFESELDKLLDKQEQVLIILNTPAHNPTGYSIKDNEWKEIVRILNSKDKRIVLLLDSSYMDYAGEPKEVRSFLPYLDELNSNIFVVICFSLSKTLNIYGLRAGSMIGLSKSKEVIEEFQIVNSQSSRATWSNAPRAPQEMLIKIYSDPSLIKRIEDERRDIRKMLLKRGEAFTNEAKRVGLKTIPYMGGFFISIPADNPDEISRILEEENIFILALKKGLRVSLAGINLEEAKVLPKRIKEAKRKLNED